ncbi:unnamed protein product, partial [Gadus morhua 'NCC']
HPSIYEKYIRKVAVPLLRFLSADTFSLTCDLTSIWQCRHCVTREISRRQEILEGEPLVTDVKSRWPALFNAKEINKEFHRISTVPLISTFFAALDRYTPRLMELFQGKGGVQGRKMSHLIVDISKDDTIETKRACVLKSLFVCLNEDPDKLFKDYMNTDTEVSACKAQTVLGVYAMKREGAEPGDELEDVGILIEGEETPESAGALGVWSGTTSFGAPT